jgi:hypothetical protein
MLGLELVLQLAKKIVVTEHRGNLFYKFISILIYIHLHSTDVSYISGLWDAAVKRGCKH